MNEAKQEELLLSLTKDISYIKAKVEKIDGIEKDVTDIKTQQSNQNEKIISLEKRLEKLEETNKWITRTICAIIITSLLSLVVYR